MKPDTSSVKSADRAFDILEYVAAAAEPPAFSQLLADLGIPRSSLFHLLNNLLARGYLEQDADTARYRLGPRVRDLAQRVPGPSQVERVLPYLRELSAELNETSGFYVVSGDTVTAIATVPGHQALAYTMKIGESAPLYAVSGGKIGLSHMPAKDIKAYLDRIKLQPITPHTLSSKSKLREEIALAQREGFAYAREEFTPGITGIATAVADENRFYGALNLAVPTARFTAERELLFKRLLQTAASSLATVLRTQGKVP